MIEVKTNLPEFRAQMALLGVHAKSAVALAMRAGAQEFAKTARGIVRKRTRALLRNIVVKRMKRIQAGMVGYIVGVRLLTKASRRGRKVPNDTFYWRFLEQGWIPRHIALRGGNRRKAEIRRAQSARKISFPFLAPAFNNASGRALSAVYAKLNQEVAKLK